MKRELIAAGIRILPPPVCMIFLDMRTEWPEILQGSLVGASLCCAHWLSGIYERRVFQSSYLSNVYRSDKRDSGAGPNCLHRLVSLSAYFSKHLRLAYGRVARGRIQSLRHRFVCSGLRKGSWPRVMTSMTRAVLFLGALYPVCELVFFVA